MDMRIDDLRGSAIAALLEQHLADMRRVSPPESVHALDLDELRVPAITFWTMWSDDQLAGCIALNQLDAHHGEIKSMRVADAFRGQGVAKQLLQHLIEVAHERNYHRLSLETGSFDFFIPARRLYSSFGFQTCAPFADYIEDANSIFMTKLLTAP